MDIAISAKERGSIKGHGLKSKRLESGQLLRIPVSLSQPLWRQLNETDFPDNRVFTDAHDRAADYELDRPEADIEEFRASCIKSALMSTGFLKASELANLEAPCACYAEVLDFFLSVKTSWPILKGL